MCLSHSLLGSLLQEDGATWFNPDAFTRQWVEQGWALDEANAQAWQEGLRRLRRAMDEGHDYAFETTLGRADNPASVARRLCAAPRRHVVLRRVERGAAFATRRGAGGRRGHAIAEHKIRERFDASRANLITLLPHLAVLHVYDNSAPADAAGLVEPLLVLELDHAGLHYPTTAEQLAQVPDWANPIVMTALEARGVS